MFKHEDSETSIWLSTTDLMSGLLVIFLFISIALTEKFNIDEASRNEKIQKAEQIDASIGRAKRTKENIKYNIRRSFTSAEQERYGLNKGTGLDVTFEDNNKIGFISKVDKVRFAAGSAELTDYFKQELHDFLPRYIRSVYREHREDKRMIKEIRIEGHTSSEWDDPKLNEDEKYIENMKLSQSRARAILAYALELEELKDLRPFIKEKVTANGLSSSKLIRSEITGAEDKEKSRRITMSVVINDGISFAAK